MVVNVILLLFKFRFRLYTILDKILFFTRPNLKIFFLYSYHIYSYDVSVMCFFIVLKCRSIHGYFPWDNFGFVSFSVLFWTTLYLLVKFIPILTVFLLSAFISRFPLCLSCFPTQPHHFFFSYLKIFYFQFILEKTLHFSTSFHLYFTFDYIIFFILSLCIFLLSLQPSSLFLFYLSTLLLDFFTLFLSY